MDIISSYSDNLHKDIAVTYVDGPNRNILYKIEHIVILQKLDEIKFIEVFDEIAKQGKTG